MDLNVLRAVANATAANSFHYVTAAEGRPLAEAGLITVNVDNRDPNDNAKVAATVTEAGVAKLNAGNHTPAMSTFAIQKGGIELPKTERGLFRREQLVRDRSCVSPSLVERRMI